MGGAFNSALESGGVQRKIIITTSFAEAGHNKGIGDHGMRGGW